jgi:RNA polymerase sigma factor (sigma-70 family)
MKTETEDRKESLGRVARAYAAERGRFVSRLRRAGRTLEEAEDLVHDAYAELVGRLPAVPGIRDLGAWLNVLVGRRAIDAWRRDKARRSAGEVDAATETLEEIIAGAGLDPHDAFVRDSLHEALDDAIAALPADQRRVVEAQVFGGMTFKQLAAATGESPDTLAARKRYALAKLARALRSWIEE